MTRVNRNYLFGAVVLTVGLLMAFLMLAINTEARARNITVLETAQASKIDLALYQRLLVDAESAQRGFLLTNDPKYLAPYEDTRKQAILVLDRIANRFQREEPELPNESVRANLRQLQQMSGAKLNELAATLALYANNSPEAAIALVRTNLGRQTMDDLRFVSAEIERTEDQRIAVALKEWRSGIVISRITLISGTLVNILLVLGTAFLLNRDGERRAELARQLEKYTDEMEGQVQRRTAELSALSSHLQHVAEREKSAIARELHDELSGLMVAAKMDVSWLERRLVGPEEDVKLRLSRLQKLLDDGLNIKRRVIESLRPTLLDNMGLVPAVKWIYQETCTRAGLKCLERYPEEDLRLNDEAAIAVFRVIQEALTNIIKHANATEVDLGMSIDAGCLKIDIRDNGVGMPTQKSNTGTQGLASMRHRVISFGGDWRFTSPPEGGTALHISLPLTRVLAPAAAAG